MSLIQSLDGEVSALRAQLQEALSAAAQMTDSVANGANMPTLEHSRSRGEHSVTDQLADIFEMISTGVGQTPNEPVATTMERLQLKLPPMDAADSVAQAQSAPTSVDHDETNDPIAWLKQAMPQLLLSEEEQGVLEREVRVVSSRLKTAPILDLLPPMQDALRPTLFEIRVQSERLVSGKIGTLTMEQTTATSSIRDHTDSALSMLDAVQQVNALQEGKFVLSKTAFPCQELVRRARELMQSTARAHDHRIAFVPPERNLTAYADFEHALGIMIDLLDNAIRYSPAGGATRISLDDLGSHILVNIADNGIGLSDDDFANVGKPFWRALRQPLVRNNPGSGLRLYLAQRILALQGGELIYSGEADKGSTFSFTLPSAAEVLAGH
jgi:signal transduction histidine kinase